MNPAPNLVLVGPMGAGKSSIGRRLAERFDLAFFDVDQCIADQVGASIPTIFEHAGETGFREHERAVLADLLAGERRLISTGGGSVLHPDNRRLMRERGFVVYLEVEVDAQLERIGDDKNRPLLQCEDRRQALYDLTAARTPFYREVADLCFDTNHRTLTDTLTELCSRLDAQWQRNRIAP